MDSDEDTPKGVGCPIRTSTDQRLLAALRGFSQRATSFIASWCQGIHRMPFSRSRFAPGSNPGISTMHRNHPQRLSTTKHELHTQITLAQHTTVISEHNTIAQTLYSAWS